MRQRSGHIGAYDISVATSCDRHGLPCRSWLLCRCSQLKVQRPRHSAGETAALDPNKTLAGRRHAYSRPGPMAHLGKLPGASGLFGVTPSAGSMFDDASWRTCHRIRDAGRSVLADYRARRPVRSSSARSYGGFAGGAARAFSRGNHIIRGGVSPLSQRSIHLGSLGCGIRGPW